MASPEQQKNDITFLKLAIRHERVMAELYEFFQSAAPASAALWAVLAKEEKMHAMWFEALLPEVESGRAHLSSERHSTELLQSALKSLEGQLKTWKVKGVSKTDAYQYAMLLEGGIIEQKFFAPCDDDALLVQDVLYKLETGTSNHFQRIREEFEKNDLNSGVLTHFRAKFKSLFPQQD